jgi:PAB1-binding protein PBP1
MTSKEYIIWLKGFVEACHEYAPTPKQWDALKDKLAEVKDETPIGFPFGVPNTAPIQTLPHITPGTTNPYRPYEVYCGDTNGTTSTPSMVVTTTPGGGSITYAKPQFVTNTAYGYPSGSTMSYTNNKPHNED